jgi:hypothetical protein
MNSLSISGSPSKPLVSRRTALTAAVGIGATVAISSVTYIASAKEDPSNANVQGPLVVHVSDLASGRLEIFTAGRRIEVKDKDLAAQLVRAAVKG